jgi:hypothetical protein
MDQDGFLDENNAVGAVKKPLPTLLRTVTHSQAVVAFPKCDNDAVTVMGNNGNFLQI